MKKILIGVLVLLLFIVGFYWYEFSHTESINTGPKQEALKVGRHSALFNNSIDAMLNAYFDMKNAFVISDTSKAKNACAEMIAFADSLKLDELKKDTTGILDAIQMQVSDAKNNAENLLTEKDITSMRKDFQMVSESIYPMLKAIHYEGKILYWQNCPMAFGEGNDASWISNIEAIENPYLGNKDTAMEHCGEIKDSIKAQ
ncbi:MAG: DUF3347 domain-containing protein [Ferruginibacter sp.]